MAKGLHLNDGMYFIVTTLYKYDFTHERYIQAAVSNAVIILYIVYI